ncbi:hypothetical protein KSZ_33330 [Dictyobacter formicarum]|uniref:Phage tail collar domain-containing protein n=1 Tax=Dictyobacter formicarum TaxID=2778368 RepID=A0ABQ3VHE5_9CHLR|nr:hypothetical protein KSZ_33330 [Dictyobacter formicarum]
MAGVQFGWSMPVGNGDIDRSAYLRANTTLNGGTMQSGSNEISTIRLRNYNPVLLRISIFARYN